MQDMNETDNKQKKGGGMFNKIKAVSRRAATVAAGTVLVLSQCLGSFGAAFAPSTAYAETSTKTATVTLADHRERQPVVCRQGRRHQDHYGE